MLLSSRSWRLKRESFFFALPRSRRKLCMVVELYLWYVLCCVLSRQQCDVREKFWFYPCEPRGDQASQIFSDIVTNAFSTAVFLNVNALILLLNDLQVLWYQAILHFVETGMFPCFESSLLSATRVYVASALHRALKQISKASSRCTLSLPIQENRFSVEGLILDFNIEFQLRRSLIATSGLSVTVR